MKKWIVKVALDHSKAVTWVMVLLTLGLGALIPMIQVDTDPENMLSEHEPVRVFHDENKKTFDLSDIVVLGVVNNEHEYGVFNPGSLKRIYEMTEFAKTLTWSRPVEGGEGEETVGVKGVDIIAPSVVDNIEQGGVGEVKFEWLMPEVPTTQEAALAVRDKALNNPLLKGTMVSEDGKAICIYLPLTSKDQSYRIYTELSKKVAEYDGADEFFITGLPVAEDTFGVEMFIQMAVSAPLAMVTIFILMLLFFRKLVLVISPMIIAMVTVISTMGLLIGLGYPVHIMSSMIPIFLMPIAVVDSVHILSEFFDRYTPEKGRRGTVAEVMESLFTPMLYTSLTSAAGFASLALTPIPPVQVFGVFVAVGILLAWFWTIIFVPAYVMFVSDKSLADFGAAHHHGDKQSGLTKLLHKTGRFTYSGSKMIIVLLVLVSVVAVYGITQIRINDNPVKWFSKSHPIRQADIELNKHFGGTYMAYLVLDQTEDTGVDDGYVAGMKGRFDEAIEIVGGFEGEAELKSQLMTVVDEKAGGDLNKEAFLKVMSEYAVGESDKVEGDKADWWYEASAFFDLEVERLKIFKQPEVLAYIEKMQQYIATIEVDGRTLVGKTNSVTDVVKKVYQEMIDGKAESYRIPETLPAVAQCLLQFQSSHRPADLWHLVTPDYKHANVWCQLTSGDNTDMNKVVHAVEAFFDENPPPVGLDHNWAGLTYINVVWQDNMVSGMLQSFLGSFLVVFIMMSILFRSPLWGLLCMVPLTITILFIYGLIGLIGKDYDMPVAVLSALTLGMAVDFAIHFLERARDTYKEAGSWKAAVPEMFGEPARAISRNVMVIAIGFLPLLAAPLVPYKTVGVFLCGIMAVSGMITLLALPAILKSGEGRFFRTLSGKVQSVGCQCGFCVIISIAGVLLVVLNIHQYALVGWTTLAWFSVVAIPVMALVCSLMSRRKACQVDGGSEKKL